MRHLFFIGDSITTGAWDTQGGWANRIMCEIFDRSVREGNSPDGFLCHPYNLGIAGDTTPRVTKRIYPEIMARLCPDELLLPIKIVISIGVNDTIFLINKDRPSFTSDEFSNNFKNLISEARRVTKDISVIGLLPVNDDLLNPIPWAPDEAYRNDLIKPFEDIIFKICKSQEIPFLPMFDSWLALPNYKELLIDGVHPNPAGHKFMAHQIRQFLFNDPFFNH